MRVCGLSSPVRDTESLRTGEHVTGSEQVGALCHRDVFTSRALKLKCQKQSGACQYFLLRELCHPFHPKIKEI